MFCLANYQFILQKNSSKLLSPEVFFYCIISHLAPPDPLRELTELPQTHSCIRGGRGEGKEKEE